MLDIFPVQTNIYMIKQIPGSANINVRGFNHAVVEQNIGNADI